MKDNLVFVAGGLIIIATLFISRYILKRKSNGWTYLLTICIGVCSLIPFMLLSDLIIDFDSLNTGCQSGMRVLGYLFSGLIVTLISTSFSIGMVINAVIEKKKAAKN